jgi:hypothetical protein
LTRAKATTSAGKHNNARMRLVDLIERTAHVVVHLYVEAVQSIRAIKSEARYASRNVKQNGFKAHRAPPPWLVIFSWRRIEAPSGQFEGGA